MWSARLRLTSLWISQSARQAADWGLRLYVIRMMTDDDAGALHYAWYLASLACLGPFLILAPLNGAISNSLPKRWVLVVVCAGALALFGCWGFTSLAWIWCLCLVAVCTAVYSPTRYALLPAAALDTRWSLARINSWIEMGGAMSIVAGVLVGQLPKAHWIILACSVLSLVAAMPVRFPSDLYRPEPLGPAIVGFFRDSRRLLSNVPTRVSMLVLAVFMGIVSAGSGAMFSQALEQSAEFSEELVRLTVLILVGAAVGALFAGVQKHLFRGLGLVPFGTLGLTIALVFITCTEDRSIPCFFLGAMGGLVSVPLRAYFQTNVPPDTRGNAMAVSNTANNLCMAGLAVLMLGLVRLKVLTTLNAQLWFLVGLGGLYALALCWILLRPLVESVSEVIFIPLYRVRGAGPGLELFPERGPVLVIANHAAWFDPVWVGKVAPRRLFPMMTSVFYDKPILRWLMINVIQAIRVQASRFRREAPELQEAIQLLDRGECVLLFPEGMMRRKEEVYIRQFGQGVWRILKDRPQTPVIACWIEGGWGCFMSYKGGPPTTNKKLDWWWPIRVAMQPPRVIDADILNDHRTTRAYLMRACLEARKFLGLEVPEFADHHLDEEDAGHD